MVEKSATPWGAAAGFWLLVSVMYAGQIWWLSRLPGEQINVRQAITWQTTYFLLWIPLTLFVWRVTSGWLPESSGGWARMLLRHVPVFALVAPCHFLSVAGVSALLGAQRGAFWPGLMMQVSGRLHLELLIYTAAAGSGAALVLHQRHRDRELATARLQAELAAARLDALRGHLQPHFLFNSLHSIAALARTGDTAGVVRLIAALSDLLRHVLDAGDRHASLREELEIVDRYLQIQRARFADRLDVTVYLAPDVADARVPLLIVQPLVENAVRHGLAPRVREGSLVVRAVRDNGRTRIDVEDTGVGLPPGWRLQDATGTGLRNLASRLAAEFGDAAVLEVGPREGGGVRATVTLPYAPS